MLRVSACFLGLSLVGMVSSLSAAPIPVSSSLGLTANATISPSPTVFDADSDSQGATTNPLSVAVSAVGSGSPGAVVASGDATASWTGTAVGQVLFDNLGWESVGLTSGGAGFGGDGWRYSFTADGDGSISLDYLTATSGTTSSGISSSGFIVLFDSVFVGVTGTNGSGNFTLPTVGGNTHEIHVSLAGGGIGGNLGTRTTFLSGTFDFEITSAVVPEPASCSLLAMGAIGLMAVGRRRKRIAA